MRACTFKTNSLRLFWFTISTAIHGRICSTALAYQTKARHPDKRRRRRSQSKTVVGVASVYHRIEYYIAYDNYTMSRPVQIVTTDDIDDEESHPMVVVSSAVNDDEVPLVNAVPVPDSERVTATPAAASTAGQTTMNYYYYEQPPQRTTVVSFNTVRTTTTTTTTTTQSLVKYDRRGCCSWLGNILWLLLGGWHMFLSWMVAGLVLCVTCIFIPCGVQCIKIACFLLCPFGKTVVYYGSPNNNSCCSSGCNFIMNVLWAVTAGWILAVQAFLTGVVLCLTIVGIPFGVQSFKLMQVCFCPFGKDFSSIQEEQQQQFTTTRRTTVQTTPADDNPNSTAARRSPPPSYQDYHRIQ